ncbi:hypothetical protein C4577_00785 [Candidatus Parcubacteria bacterium]|nr:MAG: hypothetical protein C4577_00785 [Candidatus Parcubacteria bacterium]
MGFLSKVLLFLISFSTILFLFPQKVLAVCPVCTVAVGTGLGFSRYLGIDDTVSGLWVGGLIMSLSLWTINFLNKRGIKFIGRKPIIVIAYYLLVIIPLYWTNFLGHPMNKIYGVDKLVIGTFFGSIGFVIGAIWYEQLKKANGGKAYFPFQKSLMPVIPLIILSVVFYLVYR